MRPLILIAVLAATLATASSTPAAASKIYYGCGDNICTVRPDGSKRHRITRGGGYDNPRISNKTLSFRYGSRIYLADRRARHRRALRHPTDLAEIPNTPVVSHDGRRAFFYTWHFAGGRLCFVSTARGARPKCPEYLTAERTDWAWGPRNRPITAEVFDGQTFNGDNVCVMANTRRCRRTLVELSGGRAFGGGLALSPGGRFLVAGVHDRYNDARGDHLLLFDLRKRRLVRAITRGPFDASPAWSPDGRSVVFLRTRRNARGRDMASICTARARGRRRVRCLVRNVPEAKISAPTWGG